MSGGGKTSTSTQQVSIPQDVLARYNSVNAQAQQVASQPFQDYTGQFVAPMNATQNAGVDSTNAAAGQAQPYYSAATSQLNAAQNATQPYYSAAGSGLASAAATGANYNNTAAGLAAQSAGAVNAQPLDVNSYMSPYLQNVVGSQEAMLNLQNQQQMSGELGNVIKNGAFGGDRAGIDMANLSTQQSLANNQILSSALNQGYNTALGAAQQQQGVNLSAAQANRAALGSAAGQLASIGNQAYNQGTGTAQAQQGLGQAIYGTGANTASQLASLGSGAQSAGLAGAQAQLAAGQVGQQTQQAQDTALYNQFLQQQSYPFQVAQFLANIAEGTGSLSGSTTTTTQPGGLFSDERLKENVREVGKLRDGQKIYAYNYKGDNVTHIGLMAQEVEKKHPDAVGLASGFKTVDYDRATADSARRKRYAGGLVPANDRHEFADGGAPGFDPQLMAQILSNSSGMYGPYQAALGGGSAAGGQGGPYGGAGRVPSANLPVGHLQTAGGLPQHASGLSQIDDAAKFGQNAVGAAKGLSSLSHKISDHFQSSGGLGAAADAGAPAPADLSDAANGNAISDNFSLDANDPAAGLWRGGRARRYACGGLAGYADGGDVDDDPSPYNAVGPGLNIPNDNPHAKLAVAGGQGGGQSTMGQLGQAASTAADFAKLAMMIPFQAGGRVGKDGGGALDDDAPVVGADGTPIHDFWGNDVHGNSDFTAVQNAGKKGLASAAPAPAPAQPKAYQESPADHFLYDTFPKTAAGRTVDAVKGFGRDATHAVADGLGSAWNAASDFLTKPVDDHGRPAPQAAPSRPAPAPAAAPQPPATGGGLAAAHSAPRPHPAAPTGRYPESGDLDLDAISRGGFHPATTQAVDQLGGGLAGPAAAPDLDTSHPHVATGLQAGLGAAERGLGHAAHGIGDAIGNYASGFIGPNAKAENWASLLSGLAAMEAAPTSHPFVALTQGLGAGAKSYMDTKQQQAEIQGQQASNTATLSHIPQRPGFVAVPDSGPNPQYRDASGRGYKYVIARPASGTGQQPAAAPQAKYLGTAGTPAAPQAADDFWTEGQGEQAADTKHITDVTQKGLNSAQGLTTLHGYARAVAANPTGPLQPGVLNGIKASAIGTFNDVARTLGHPELSINGLADQQLFEKMSKIAAADRTEHGGQTSLGALMENLQAVANPQMERPAAIHIMSQNYVDNQKAIDHAGYYGDIANSARESSGNPNAFSTNTADRAFASDYSQGRYQQEQAAVEKAITNGAWGNTLDALAKIPNTPDGQQLKDRIYSAFDRHWGPGMHRYLVGAQ